MSVAPWLLQCPLGSLPLHTLLATPMQRPGHPSTPPSSRPRCGPISNTSLTFFPCPHPAGGVGRADRHQRQRARQGCVLSCLHSCLCTCPPVCLPAHLPACTFARTFSVQPALAPADTSFTPSNPCQPATPSPYPTPIPLGSQVTPGALFLRTPRLWAAPSCARCPSSPCSSTGEHNS